MDFGHGAVFENQLTGGRSADSQLVFFLAHGEPRKTLLDNERCDSLVTGGGIDRGKEDKKAGFLAIGDPQLASVKNVVAALERGPGLQSERIRSRTSFAECVGAAGVGSHARQEVLLLFLVAPAQQGIVDQRVLHVHHDACGSVHPRHFLNRQDRFKELAAATAVLLGNFNSHETELKKLVNQILIEDAFLVHLLHQRADFLIGKLADVVAKHDFVFGERGQRGGRRNLQCGVRHESTFKVQI